MTTSQAFDIFGTVARTVSMLALVLGVLILTLYLMKRFLRGRSPVGKNEMIQSVATHYFSHKERIEIVDVEGVRVVVGIAPGAIAISALSSGAQSK